VNDYQKNKNLDLTISSAKPPIFWKDKEIIKQQINKWKLADISKLLGNVNQIELLIKKNKTDPINIVRNFIIETISLPINSKF
jgi:DNA polymerase-3 subunit delta